MIDQSPPIHPSVVIPKSTYIGHYNVIEEGVRIGENCWIGNFNHIRPDTTLSDHSQIRHYCHIAGKVFIGKRVKIFQYSNIAKGTIVMDDAFIGPGVVLMNTWKISHARSFNPTFDAPTIGMGVRIGGGARILPGIVLGEQCMIGAGAVVTKDAQPFGIYMGNPAVLTEEVPLEERL
jgi:acetyltransferase-like isoleucine patch superfamily enzyme